MKRITAYKRARAAERKVERRDAILDAAERQIVRAAYCDINMLDIARRLHLAKGTLYLYFPTKEALFLAVIRRCYEQFFARVEAALVPSRRGREPVVTALLGALDQTPALRHLACVLHTVLEHNIGDAEVRTFKHFLRERVLAVGRLIDRQLRWRAGSGAQLLLRFHVLMIGLHHVSTPSRAVARALSDPHLALFRIEFRRQLAEMLALTMHPIPEEE